MPRKIPAIVVSNDPGKPPRIEKVDPSTLRLDRPVYELLVAALQGAAPAERRIVVAGDLRIAPEFRFPDEPVAAMALHLDAHRRINQEFLREVLVMERSDGSLWVYDDCVFVEAVQRVDPTIALPCEVYKDPTQ